MEWLTHRREPALPPRAACPLHQSCNALIRLETSLASQSLDEDTIGKVVESWLASVDAPGVTKDDVVMLVMGTKGGA